MTRLRCNSNSICRATYCIYMPSFKLIYQSMLKKTWKTRTDRHCYGIIRPLFKRAYVKIVTWIIMVYLVEETILNARISHSFNGNIQVYISIFNPLSNYQANNAIANKISSNTRGKCLSVSITWTHQSLSGSCCWLVKALLSPHLKAHVSQFLF